MTTPNLTSPEPPTAALAPPADPNPFRYGWRYVNKRLPDGRIEVEEVPLTLEDVLHPQEDDVIPENTVHEPERGHLTGAFRTRLSRLYNGHVFSDCIIDWNVPGLRNHSPDVSVFEDVRGLPLPRLGTFRRADFGGRCLLAVEIVSPDTRTNDVDRKPEHYHRAGVRQYVIVDQQREDGPRQIVDRRWTADGFVIEPADSNGRVRLDSLGLLIGLRDNRVVIFDAATGDELREYAGEYASRVAAEEDARKEKLARSQAEDRIRELEEELRRARGSPPE